MSTRGGRHPWRAQYHEVEAACAAIGEVLPPADVVVGIAYGGLIPAGMLAQQLRLPVDTLVPCIERIEERLRIAGDPLHCPQVRGLRVALVDAVASLGTLLRLSADHLRSVSGAAVVYTVGLYRCGDYKPDFSLTELPLGQTPIMPWEHHWIPPQTARRTSVHEGRGAPGHRGIGAQPTRPMR
jgi:hypoxanthine phosphoribosyltransferase